MNCNRNCRGLMSSRPPSCRSTRTTL